jgi:cellulose synthase/poly-beta-1,6-N-acetylglucosamine synthase-like glycosyltransferase
MAGAGGTARTRARPRLRSRVSTTRSSRPPIRSPAELRDAPPRAIDAELAAQEAVERLVRERPSASAKTAQALAAPLALAIAVATIAAGALAGATAWTAFLVLASVSFAALCGFRVCAALTSPPRSAPPGASRANPPVYTVLVPLRGEVDVAAELVAALKALAYPREKLDIKLVLEADDAETVAAVEALRLGPPFEVLKAPPGEPRTKPRALNFALAFARGDFVVIYDAEDRPSPDQLLAALDAFDAGDDRLACVQAPLVWYNARETWLTRQFALEYAALFSVVLPALARWGWPFPLGGTSNHFRRGALEDAGGWDPYNVTEDADLGLRLAELGRRTTVISSATQEEAVTTLRPWTRQRARWIKGFLQTLLVRLVRLPALARLAGARGLAALAFTIVLPLASSFLHGPIAAFTLVLLALGKLPLWAGLFLAAGYLAAAATAWVGLARSDQRGLAPAILLMPLYWPLLTIAAVRGLGDLARRPFHWEKTAHGITRIGSSVVDSGLVDSALGGGLAGAPAAPPSTQQPRERGGNHEPRDEEGHERHDHAGGLGEHGEEVVQREHERRERVPA